DSIELIIRYRGPASEEFPYYVEGPLGEVLANLYTGVYAVAPTTGIDGFLYDPAGLDTSDLNLTAVIQYDPEAFDVMVDHVLLRQTAPVEDTRSWTETNLY